MYLYVYIHIHAYTLVYMYTSIHICTDTFMYKFALGRHDCWYLPKLYKLSDLTQTGSKSSSAIVFVCVRGHTLGTMEKGDNNDSCHKYE